MVSTLGAIDHKEATATPPPSLKKKKNPPLFRIFVTTRFFLIPPLLRHFILLPPPHPVSQSTNLFQHTNLPLTITLKISIPSNQQQPCQL